MDSRALDGSFIAAIGSSTADELKKYGILADLVPAVFQAEGLIEKMKDITGKRMLLVRAAEARDILPESLRASGNDVDIAIAYKTIMPPESREQLNEALSRHSVDMVTFASSSTASYFAEMLDDKSLVKKFHCASIGPVTSATARNLGFHVVLEAGRSTIEGLAEKIIEFHGKV